MSGRLHCVTTDQSAKGGGFRIPHLSGDFLDGQACRLQQIPRGFNPDALHELDRGEAAGPCNPFWLRFDSPYAAQAASSTG